MVKDDLFVLLTTGVPSVLVVTPEEEQTIENGDAVQFQVAVEDEAGNPTTAQKMTLVCKVNDGLFFDRSD